jgi:transposase
MLYVLRTGCAWRHLPRDFPPWQTVLRWFLRLARAGAFEQMGHALATADRERVGRGPSPTGAVVDAQAARSGGVGVAGCRGFDGAKRVVGRKRHALVDTDGRLLLAAVSPANLHDSHGGIALLRTSRRPWPTRAGSARRQCAPARPRSRIVRGGHAPARGSGRIGTTADSLA